jgi:asparagine synthase (glutamine-hydrolysing)
MAFRGPDGQDVWHDESAALGCAAFRTVDDQVDRRQPFTLDGDLWITADVRLAGRRDLITRLQHEHVGISEKTDDAELVLRAYERWGDRCLEHLLGDFAFAIWDARSRRLFCARDHFGVAQFYYALAGSHLLFSNTLECLLLDRRISDELNETAIADCVLFRMNMDPAETTFAAIHRLPPAHTLTWADGRVTLQRYWDIPPWTGFLHYPKAEDYVERFRELFTTAVTDRLRTTRVSVQLSGGLDSTSVAVTARRVLASAGRPFLLRAQTTVLDGLMPHEEGRFAAQVAETAGFPIEELRAIDYPNENPAHTPELLTPEPTYYRWTGLEYDLVRRAASHGALALTGHGGDAALMFMPSYSIEWIRRGEVKRMAAAVWHHVRLFRRPPILFRKAAWRHLRSKRDVTVEVPDWLEPAFVRRVGLEDRSQTLLRRSHEEIETSGMARSPFWSHIFACADGGFTRLPLKYAHPFFDRRLVTFLLALPPVPWFPRKALLRDAMRGDLPEAVLQRRKTPLSQGFTQALARQRGLDAAAQSLLTSVPGLNRFIVRHRFAARLQALSTVDLPEHQALVAGLGIAHWMLHWRRPRPALSTNRVTPQTDWRESELTRGATKHD